MIPQPRHLEPNWRLSIYARLLSLYPDSFRDEYREPILRTLRDAHDARSGEAFWLQVYCDLFKSLLQERTRTVRTLVKQQPFLVHAAILGVIFSLLGLASSVVAHQLLRSGADQPQIQMVNQGIARLASGESPDRVIAPGHVDSESSLEPFLVYYDDQGMPANGTGYLDHQLLTPPRGVFESVRAGSVRNLTLQPRHGVRIASVIRRVSGPHPGFLLAGRSLQLVEQQEDLLFRMSLTVWVIVLALLALSAMLLQRHVPRPMGR